MNKSTLIPCTKLLDKPNAVTVHPKALILRALGGFVAEQSDNAEKVNKALGKRCIETMSVIVPDEKGNLRFVDKEDLIKLVKCLTDEL